MSTLNFKGKTFVQNHHLAVKFHELVPDKKKSLTSKVSLNDNLIIHGDNLAALKALLPTYAGKVKCIYIDPPYNTGNEGWAYNDNVNSPMMKEWLGKVIDKDDLTRHDKWLCMMLPRLKLLRELLTDDGIIFISIDDNEVHHLKSVMDDVFTEDRFIGIITWFKKRKGSFLSKELISLTEYILAYKKCTEKVQLFGGKPSEEGTQPIVKRTNARKVLAFKKDFVTTSLNDGHYKIGTYGQGSSAVKLLNSIKVSGGKIVSDFKLEGPFTWTQARLDEEIANGVGITINTLNLQPRVFRKYSEEDHKGLPSFIDGREISATTDDAYECLKNIFQTDRVFEYSKPYQLIKTLINAATFNDKNSLILDSFAGSGTTAHAVLELNKEDGGNRKFILVETEDYADKITAERVRRVIKGVESTKNENLIDGFDSTFSYFELGKPIDIDQILSGKNMPAFDELARYVFYTATGEEFDPKKMNKKTRFIGESKNYEVYLYYEPDVEWLKKTAFNLDAAEKLGKPGKKRRLVFAPAKYLSQEHLDMYKVDFQQLPFDIYKRVG